MELLVKNGKFKFPKDGNSVGNYIKNNPKHKNKVRINQVLWDWNTMQFGPFDGGLINVNE